MKDSLKVMTAFLPTPARPVLLGVMALMAAAPAHADLQQAVAAAWATAESRSAVTVRSRLDLQMADDW